MNFKTALLAIALTALTPHAFAEDSGQISGSLPSSVPSSVRLSPVAGASSFSTTNTPSVTNFDRGFSAGLLADFGSGSLNFETGIITIGAQQSTATGTATVNVQNWGIPLLAKLNFSGNPHKTIFVKAGAMPLNTVGNGTNAYNVMGVAGLGAGIPLGRYSSILLDASYNRMFTQSGGLTDYSGIALLAGLTFNL